MTFFIIYDSSAQTSADIPKIIPPSPNAAALEKFNTIPVDYSTGIPSIGYPLCTWIRNHIQLNLALSYHAGGNKVDDMASNTGLGWSLTGLGQVTRTVRGLPDDHPTMGYINTPILPALSTYQYDPYGYLWTNPAPSFQALVPTNTAINTYNSSDAWVTQAIDNNQLDGEQDIFSYSVPGQSGRFVIDKNKNVVLLEQTKLKVQVQYNAGGYIAGFVLTDVMGAVYKCDFVEEQSSESISSVPVSNPMPVFDCNSSWLLTKILDPSALDSIIINYSNGSVTPPCKFETGITEVQTASLNPLRNAIMAPSSVFAYSVLTTYDTHPTSISFPDGSHINFTYNFNRQDFNNNKGLTDIEETNLYGATVKKYHLFFSYFPSGPTAGWNFGPVSNNDFSVRLRLDSINLFNASGSSALTTSFIYNSTLLNGRASHNLDYWGYNVDPSRGNLSYVAKIPLTHDYAYLTPFWDGANREPDTIFSQAAILKTIKYPGKGSIDFVFENNKAYDSVKFYEDSLLIGPLEWNQSQFNLNNLFSLPSASSSSIQLLFRVVEISPRGSVPVGCFAESQDAVAATFQIRSTDATFSQDISFTYGQLTGAGYKQYINFSLNKNYRIKFVYNISTACAWSYPFKAVVSGYYHTAKRDKVVGGLRIKSISSHDGLGGVRTKWYQYNDSLGNHTSGAFTGFATIPNYTYYRKALDETKPGTPPSINTPVFCRTSSPSNTISFNSSPLVYTRVQEFAPDSSLVERVYDPLLWLANGGSPEVYPYVPIQDIPSQSGLLKKVYIRDSLKDLKTEQTITYNKVQIYLSSQSQNRSLKVGVSSYAAPFYPATYWVAEQFFPQVTRTEVVSDETKVFTKGLILTSKSDKTYSASNYYLSSVKTTNSRNEERTETYSYSGDGTGSVYTSMIAKNMLAYLTSKTLSKTGVLGGELYKQTTNYGLFQSGSLPMIETFQTSLLGNTLQTDLTFNSYDDKGNVTQYTAKDGVITSFIWGYKKQYPVARIIGRSYSDAVSLSGLVLATVDNPSSDAVMRAELNKLRTLTGCFVTTLTYKPLVGVSSETDANGVTAYYEYDSFNRLSLVRDKDNYIIKKVCYNYAGQVIDCGVGTQAMWQAQSSSCQVSGGQFTGSRIVVEKDLNPASPTYNQTRNTTYTNDASCVCVGADKKVVNGVCETGVKQCYSSVYNSGANNWTNTYYYQWSDSSVSTNFVETAPATCYLTLP